MQDNIYPFPYSQSIFWDLQTRQYCRKYEVYLKIKTFVACSIVPLENVWLQQVTNLGQMCYLRFPFIQPMPPHLLFKFNYFLSFMLLTHCPLLHERVPQPIYVSHAQCSDPKLTTIWIDNIGSPLIPQFSPSPRTRHPAWKTNPTLIFNFLLDLDSTHLMRSSSNTI